MTNLALRGGAAGNRGLFVQRARFPTVLVDSPALLEAAHALRFQVYCCERGFEHAENHPSGLETDAYDCHSIHGLLLDQITERAIGTVRMIFPSVGPEDSFPMMALLRASALDLSDYINTRQSIEISRFAISKEFRLRNPSRNGHTALSNTADTRDTDWAFLSLLQFVLRESIKRNVLFWTAVMEPKLLRLLARMGVTYTPIGPTVRYHGIRQPCYCYIPEMLENVRLVRPECWHVLTDGGTLHEALAAYLAKDARLRALRRQLEIVAGNSLEVDYERRVPTGPRNDNAQRLADQDGQLQIRWRDKRPS